MIQFPPLVELHRMCKQRAGHLNWPLSRLNAILEDFPDLEWRMVAGRCLDYIAERPGVSDGPRTLRTFMEREQRTVFGTPEQRKPPPRDILVRCLGCGTTFNITAEVRRRRARGIHGAVSVCESCYDQDREELHGPESTDQRQKPGDEVRDQEQRDSEG